MLHLSRSRVHKAADDDYDTSHRSPARGGGGRRGKAEYAGPGADRGRRRQGDGTEPLLEEEEGIFSDEGEGESEGSGHARLRRKQQRQRRRRGSSGHGTHSSLSQHSHLSHLSGQSHMSSQHSHHSHQSAASAASQTVYRPPDYPSSLFRHHATADQSGDEEDFRDDSSSRSDSMLYMLGESDRESDRDRDRDDGFRFSHHTDMTERTTDSDHVLSDDHLAAGKGAGEEERGSSEDDYYQHQYDTGFSQDDSNDLDMHMDMHMDTDNNTAGLRGLEGSSSSSSTSSSELAFMIAQNAQQGSLNLSNPDINAAS